jgi:Rieske 2Fe-2S family protein
VLCPYHAWSYRLDGSLRRAPRYNEVEGFKEEDFGLVELPTAEWQGLIFVDGSGVAGPFSAQVEGLGELLAPYELDRLRVAASHDYVVNANWKLLVENYQECYHCPSIHPELCVVTDPDSGSDHQPPGQAPWVGGWMSLRDGADTMSLDGRSSVAPLRGLDEGRQRIVEYLTIFPNVLLSLHPDYAMTHRLMPFGPDRTRVECSWSFAPEELERASFDPSYAVDFWDVTNREDWGACESVQRGLASEHAIPGVLSPAEISVYQFVTIVARGYLGPGLSTQTSRVVC